VHGVASSDWSILFYVEDGGESPVRAFLRGLDQKTRARFGWSIEQLRVRNISAREPLVKKLNSSLWELREESQTNIYRVIYCFVSGRRIVLLHGFQKKTQKTPRGEIEIAEQRRLRFLERESGESMTREAKRDLAREGEEQYQEWRRELLSTPELRGIYEEEAAKKELWLQLVEARQSAGLTQAELAERLGVSQAQVARLEKRGYDAYTLSSLRRYVDALGEGFRLEVSVRAVEAEAVGATSR
jgi:phage-related protein/predicted XRE-type DNA-binding protein